MSETYKETLEYKYLYIEDSFPIRPAVDEEEKEDEKRGVVVIDIFDTED